jgi:hypothetical protein
MPLVHRADAQQGPRDRGIELLGEGQELGLRAGMEDAVAGEDDRALCGGDLRRGDLELLVVAVHRRSEAGQPRDHLLRGRMGRLRLLLERVLRDVDVDRAGPAAAGDVERLGDHARQLVRVADEVVVLRHRQGDAVDVDLLERVLADQGRGHVAGDRDHRDRVEHRGADAGHQVGRAGPRGADAHADLAGRTGVPVGGVRAALLVAHEDVPQLRVVAEDVVQRQDHAARVAEHDLDALPEQRLAQDVGTDSGARSALPRRDRGRRRALVEHLALRPLDRGGVLGALGRHVAPARAVALRQRHDRPPSGSVTSASSLVAACSEKSKTPAFRRGSGWLSVGLIASCDRSSASLRAPAERR